jgi:hypothetical protein
MMQTVDEMISALKRHPEVLGLVGYGSDHRADDYAMGDCDLFVVLDHKDPTVESLHFYVGSVPVDLNLITLDEIRHLDVTDGFHLVALLDGRILHDPTSKVTSALEELRRRQKQSPLKELSEHAIAFTRHGHRHVFSKIKGRLNTMPVFCRFLLSTNIYWLIKTYFSVRGLVFKGEKYAIEYLQHHEPEIFEAMTEFYATHDLERQAKIAKTISERILAPVGGMWRNDEILAFGDKNSQDLEERGYKVFRSLFGEENGRHLNDGGAFRAEV